MGWSGWLHDFRIVYKYIEEKKAWTILCMLVAGQEHYYIQSR